MESVISKLLKYSGLNAKAFSEKIGLERPQAIYDLIKGKTKSISPAMKNKILSVFTEINPSWLLTGEGEMLRRTDDSRSDEPAPPAVMDAIPLIPMDAFAGYPPQQYSDLPVEDYYHVAEFSKADFLIRVKGDSMTPKLNGGDIVACKKIYERLFFQWHRIYVIYTNSQGVMIKRVEQSERDGCIRLVSDNPSYQPFDIPESDIADIALVMGAITLE